MFNRLTRKSRNCDTAADVTLSQACRTTRSDSAGSTTCLSDVVNDRAMWRSVGSAVWPWLGSAL
jgi:hypothetical protein